MSEFRRVLLSRTTILYILIAVLVGSIFFMFDCSSQKQITLSGDELISYIESYPEFLKSVQSNSENYNVIAALSDGFSAENIRKTTKDYSSLCNVQLVFGENKGFVLLSGYIMSDVLILAVTLLVASSFFEERKKGLVSLVRSTKNGRRILSVQRTAIIIITALITSLVMHLGCYGVSLLFCGDMGILRPIQSIPEFSLCPYSITILEYLGLSIIFKAFAAAIAGLMLYFISDLLDSVLSFALCVALLVIEYILYKVILPTDRLAILKFCNITALLRTDVFFKEYCNLNILGNAVGFLSCAIAVIGVLFILLCSCCVFITSGGERNSSSSNRFTEKINSFVSRKSPCLPLAAWEIKKIFINQKGAVILVFIVWISITSSMQYRYVLPSYSPTEDMYYKKYSGTITNELKTAMIDDYNNLSEEYERLAYEFEIVFEENNYVINDDLQIKQNMMNTINVNLYTLDMLLEKVESGLAYTAESGIEVQLIKTKTYELLLLRDKATTNKNALYIIIAMIGIFAGICANEKRCNMNSLLTSTPNGRVRLTSTKITIIVFTSVLLTLSVFAPQMLLIGANDYNNLDATAQSIDFLQFIPINISIKGYLTLMFVIRVISAIAVGIIVMVISQYCKSSISAVCISLVLIIIPSTISATGVLNIPTFIDWVGFCVI